MSTPRFAAVYQQFLGEMELTFPELEKSAAAAFKNTSWAEFSKAVAPVLHQIAVRDGSIFTDKGAAIAPGVVMTKKLWKDAGKATQKAIWDFLSSLVLLASYEKRHSTNSVDGGASEEPDFSKFFDVSGADVDLRKMFETLGSQFSGQSFSSFFDGIKEAAETMKEQFGASMGISGENPFPEKMFKGHIAKIAEDLAREFKPEDFGLSTEMLEGGGSAATFEYLQTIFSKNPELLMRGAKKIASRIQDKLKNGSVTREQLIAEAEELMQGFKDNPMFKQVFEQLNAGLRGAGDFGMGGGSNEPSARRKAAVDRLREKLAAKQAAAAAAKKPDAEKKK
uniref:Uncharacterized protein n=1 Tax=viral metagenome TaxID=1070528 RepID=A0A6C0DQI4_9ZZZZ